LRVRLGNNGGMSEQPHPEGAEAGWFAYEPIGGNTEDGDEDPLIRVVQLVESSRVVYDGPE
jgi:hypothetical protein